MASPETVAHLRGVLALREEICGIYAGQLARLAEAGPTVYAATEIEAARIAWMLSRIDVHGAQMDVIAAETV